MAKDLVFAYQLEIMALIHQSQVEMSAVWEEWICIRFMKRLDDVKASTGWMRAHRGWMGKKLVVSLLRRLDYGLLLSTGLLFIYYYYNKHVWVSGVHIL